MSVVRTLILGLILLATSATTASGDIYVGRTTQGYPIHIDVTEGRATWELGVDLGCDPDPFFIYRNYQGIPVDGSTFHGTVRSDSTGSSFVSRWDLYGQISGDSRKITGVMTAEDTHGMPCIDPVPYSTHLARTTPGGSSRRCAPVLSGPRAITDVRATNITCARVRRALRKWPSSVPFQFICVKHEGRRRECRWLGEKFGFSVS